MATVWTATAALCPALVSPSGLLIPTDGTPTQASSITAGATTAGLTAFNVNAEKLDLLGRVGGGAFALAPQEGSTACELTAGSGLTLNIAAGNFLVDSPGHRAATTLALTNNVYNWVWLTASGSLVAATSATTALPSTPASARVFLGRVLTAAGAITQIDYSGRLELRGGTLYRRTADAGMPTDTPPASCQILTRTAGGLYLWDGDQYVSVGGSGGTVPYWIISTRTYQVALYEQAQVYGSLQIDGVLRVDGQMRITA